MSAGIYMYNGVLAYSMDLEKKLKRRKSAIVIEEYKGENPTEKELQKMLDKHLKIIAPKEEIEDKPLKYHWRNKITNETIHSIYDTLDRIPKINIEEWESITY